MNRFERIKKAVSKMTIEDFFIRNRGGFFDTDEDILDKSYSKSELVYICISTTARAISQVPLMLGVVDRNGDWEEVPPGVTFWYDVLRRPNYLQDYYTFIESIISYLLLDGNVWIVQYPLQDVDPFSLWVLQKKHMSAIRDRASGQLIGWNYRPGPGVNLRLEMKDVAHVFFWNPYDPIMGLAPIDAGSMSIVTDYKAAKFNQVFFDQGASIGGVLSTEQGLTDRQIDRLKKEIENKYTGYDQAHRMLLLDGGLKFSQTSPSHKDMMFPEMRNLDKERILQIFGMKKAVISVTDDLNRATAWQQERSWWRSTNLPIMNMIADALNFTFFEAEGLEARFDTSTVEALQIDFADKVETATKLAELGFTANEINEKLELGFGVQPWRDYAWIENSKRPLGADAPAVEEEEPPELPPAQAPPQLPAPEEEPEEDETIDIGKLVELKPNFDERGEKIWKSLVDKVKPIEKTFKNKTRRMFFEWRKRAIDWLYSQAEKSAVKDEQRPFIMTRPVTDIDEMAVEPMEELKAAADLLWEESMMAGLETIGLEIGEALDIDLLSLPEARDFLQMKRLKIGGLEETQSRLLKKELIEGMQNNETLEQIAARFRGKFGTAANRATTIARTETFGALNFGRKETIRKTKYMTVQWFTSKDEKVRRKPYNHSAMHGRSKTVNEKWRVEGSLVPIRFPADPMGEPGNIINCRCIEMVVLESFNP